MRFLSICVCLFLLIIESGKAYSRIRLNEECTQFKASLPAEYKQYTLTVPEDWRRPNGRQIKIFVYTNFKLGQKPVLHLYGGPLGVDHYSYTQFHNKASALNLGFIYMDQRGTGCSDPVPIGHSTDVFLRSSLYNTTQIVLDAEHVRKVILGASTKWKVFGQSFGAYILNRYVQLFPQSITEGYNYAGGFVETMTEFMAASMLQQQSVAKIFLTRFPEAKAMIQTLKQKATNEDCLPSKIGTKVCGLVLIESLLDAYLGLPEYWPQFVKDYPTFFLPNQRLNLRKIQTEIGYILDFFYDPILFPVAAVWRQEVKTFHPSGSLSYDCAVAYQWLELNGLPRSKMIMDHCRIVQSAFSDKIVSQLHPALSKVPVEKTLKVSDFLVGLKSNPNLKYFIYSGALDIYDRGPHRYQALAKQKQVKYTHFPNSGHFGYFFEAQFWRELAL